MFVVTDEGEFETVQQLFSITENSAVITNLIPYTVYTFRVRYVNSEGNGPWSTFEEGEEGFIIRTREAGTGVAMLKYGVSLRLHSITCFLCI